MDSHHSLSREGNVSSTSLSKRELVYGDGLSDFYVFVVSCERTQGTSGVGRRETSVVVEALRLRQFFLERLSDQGPEGTNTGADHSIAVLLGKPACSGQPFQTLVIGVTSWVGWGGVGQFL